MTTETQIIERLAQIEAIPDKYKDEAWKRRRRQIVRWLEDQIESGVDDPAATWREINRACDALTVGQDWNPAGCEVAVSLAPKIKDAITNAVKRTLAAKPDPPDPVPEPAPPPAEVKPPPQPKLEPEKKPVRPIYRKFEVGARVAVGKHAGTVVKQSGVRVFVMRDGFQRSRSYPADEVTPIEGDRS